MNIPTFPTDNLYKFLAISGIGIILTSVLYAQTFVYKLQDQVIELDGAFNELDYESTLLEKQISVLESAAEPSESDFRSAQAANKKLHLKKIQIKTKFELLKAKRTQADELLRNSYIGSLVGLLMSFFGFSSWYLKVQRYQDRVLATEAKQNEA